MLVADLSARKLKREIIIFYSNQIPLFSLFLSSHWFLSLFVSLFVSHHPSSISVSLSHLFHQWTILIIPIQKKLLTHNPPNKKSIYGFVEWCFFVFNFWVCWRIFFSFLVCNYGLVERDFLTRVQDEVLLVMGEATVQIRRIQFYFIFGLSSRSYTMFF